MYHNKWILYICGYMHNVNCSKIRGPLQSMYVCVCLRARACTTEIFCQDVANEVSLLKMNEYVFIYQLSF